MYANATSPSSNRTCGFPASGFPRRTAFVIACFFLSPIFADYYTFFFLSIPPPAERKNQTIADTAATIAAEIAIVKSAPNESLSADERRRLANLVTRVELLQLTLAFLPADAKGDATALASAAKTRYDVRLVDPAFIAFAVGATR